MCLPQGERVDGDNYAWEVTGMLGIRDSRQRGTCRAGPLQRPLRRGPPARRGSRDRGVARRSAGGAGERVPVVAGGAGGETHPLVRRPAASRWGRVVRSTVLAPAASARSSAFLVSASPIPRPRAASVDDHVLDPGAETGRDREHHQREEADDLPIEAGGQQRRRLGVHHPLDGGPVGQCRARGQLGHQMAQGSATSSVASCTTSMSTLTPGRLPPGYEGERGPGQVAGCPPIR